MTRLPPWQFTVLYDAHLRGLNWELTETHHHQLHPHQRRHHPTIYFCNHQRKMWLHLFCDKFGSLLAFWSPLYICILHRVKQYVVFAFVLYAFVLVFVSYLYLHCVFDLYYDPVAAVEAPTTLNIYFCYSTVSQAWAADGGELSFQTKPFIGQSQNYPLHCECEHYL